MKEKYIRIGTTLYKVVQRPLISGDYIEEKIPWSYETLRQDYGKNNLPEVEKYDGFCIIPDHIHYEKVYGTYLITDLERRFLYSDSIKITREQVEEYERLIREQAESMERARRKVGKLKQLKKDAEITKRRR
jgi:hypothetical protein